MRLFFSTSLFVTAVLFNSCYQTVASGLYCNFFSKYQLREMQISLFVKRRRHLEAVETWAAKKKNLEDIIQSLESDITSLQNAFKQVQENSNLRQEGFMETLYGVLRQCRVGNKVPTAGYSPDNAD